MVGFYSPYVKKVLEMFYQSVWHASSFMLEFSWWNFSAPFWTLSDSFQFDHYYRAYDALMCLAGTNGMGSTVLNRKLQFPANSVQKTFTYIT